MLQMQKSRRNGTPYIQFKKKRLIGLVTSCIGTAFSLLDDPKEMKIYWKLKGIALDCTLWRICFGRG
jgi:hypothetical protein